MKLLSFWSCDNLVGTVGISVFKAYPSKLGISDLLALAFSSSLVAYPLKSTSPLLKLASAILFVTNFSVASPLAFNYSSVIYSLGIDVKYPLSFVSWLVLVGISDLRA